MKTIPLVWTLLVALTVASFALAAAGAPGEAHAVLLLGALKAGLVAWYFMGLRAAHPLWRFALGALVAAPLLVVAAAA